MGLFNRNHEKNSGGQAPSENPGGNPWENVSQVAFAGGNERTMSPEEMAQAENERQQRKVVAGILYGAEYALSNHDAAIREGDRDSVLRGMAEGQIGDSLERGFLSAIKDPIHSIGAQMMFDRGFRGQRQPDRILAYMTGLDPRTQFNQVTPQNINNFLQRFPLPMDFEGASAQFLEEIRQKNPPEKYQEYVTTMSQFKYSMYGKRQEYWEQIKRMHAEAEARFGAGATTDPLETVPEGPRVPERAEMEEQREWLSRARVEGDPWEQNGQKYQLTPEALASLGLGPEYKTRVDDVEMRFSGIFKIGSRDAVVGYIQDEQGDVHVRGYYRSNSQGLWRYLPDYIGGEDGHIDYYGKGGFNSAEEATTLPWELQRDLSAIAMSPDGQRPEVAEQTYPEYVLGGTAVRYGSKDELIDALSRRTARGAFYREVSPRAMLEFNKLGQGYKVPPENLSIQGALAPNFRDEIASFSMEPAMYGHVEASCFPSNDGRLKYMMCENSQGQAWIGSVQAKARVTTTGCREQWVSAGDLATPLYEYGSQSGGYGGEPGPRNYVSMWQNYLSKAPIIRSFLSRTKRTPNR